MCYGGDAGDWKLRQNEGRITEDRFGKNEMGPSPVVSNWVAMSTQNRLHARYPVPVVNKLRCPDWHKSANRWADLQSFQIKGRRSTIVIITDQVCTEVVFSQLQRKDPR